MTIDTSANKVRAYLALANGKIEDTTTQTLTFNNWKFDSSTKINICSNSANAPHAYCEVLGMQTWYTYAADPLPLFLLGGFYRIFLVFWLPYLLFLSNSTRLFLFERR